MTNLRINSVQCESKDTPGSTTGTEHHVSSYRQL